LTTVALLCFVLLHVLQVVPDPKFQQQGSSSRLMFYLDGAHTPESMITCGTWFAQVTSAATADTSRQQQQQQVVRVLVFNCMKERNPAILLPHLHSELQQHNAAVHLALFVPPDSQYAFLPTSSTQQLVAEAHQDLSWQQQLLGVWQQCQEAAAAAAAAGSSEQQLAAGRALLPPLPEVPGGLLVAAPNS
jgi:folylpolyglutamate synthase